MGGVWLGTPPPPPAVCCDTEPHVGLHGAWEWRGWAKKISALTCWVLWDRTPFLTSHEVKGTPLPLPLLSPHPA